jgi:hypothetical protein
LGGPKKYIQMTIEELLAKKLSQEIDLQVLTNLLKGIDASEEEIKKHVDSMTEKHEIEIDRELKGGDKGIHKID